MLLHKRSIFLASAKTTRRPIVLRYMLTAAPQVDREAGIIRNVAVITVGVTKPSGDGQGPIDVDQVTLQQVMQAINSRQIGVKSRITHPELETADGVEIDELPRRLGYIFNARLEGNCVRADMQFHDPKSTAAVTLMDIAERDPASCGLSIVDDLATIQPSPTAQTGFVLRIEKLDAVDWVGTPAANPAGMLSAKRRHIRLTQESLMFNEAQLAKLAELGLTEGADPQAFYDTLTAEQKAEVDALASSATDTPAEATMRRKLSARARITNKAVIRLAKARLEGEEPEKKDEEGAKLNAGLNEAQIAYLVSVGLPADAAPDAVAAFIATLTPEQLAELDALATPVESTTTMRGGKKNATDPEEKEPVTTAAAKSAVKNAIKAERDRQKEIRAIALRCGYDDKWIDRQIDSDAGLDEVRRIALASLNREPANMPTTRVKVGADLNRDSLNDAVQDAIMLRAGRKQFVKFDGSRVALSATNQPQIRKPHDRAAEFRDHNLIEMGRRYLVALGYHKADSMNRPSLATLLMSRQRLQSALSGIYLAHSTGDFPHILADAMGKVLRAEYALAPHTWNLWCRQGTAPDFKDIKKLQLSEAADLQLVPEGDDYQYGTLTESKEVYALSTYGKGLKFTRQSMINDDLGAFDRFPSAMGRAAGRKVEGLAIAVLTSNAAMADNVALFATAHANLTTGALSVTSLGSARSKLRRQTALGSTDPLELEGRFLLVPETISTAAQQLIGSTVDPALNNAANNPFANKLQVVPSARLDLNSTAQWYLIADPASIDTVEVSFLEGEETPVIEEEDEFDSDCRKVKVRHHAAAKAIDHRGMVRSSGS